MADYASMDMPQLENAFYGAFNSCHRWKGAAAAWRDMGVKLQGAQDGMDKAWDRVEVFEQNVQSGDSEAYFTFENAIADSHGSILGGESHGSVQGGNGGTGWATFAQEVGARLDSTARIIADNHPFFVAAKAAHDAAEEGSDEQEHALQRARLFVWNVANSVQLTFSGLQVPTTPFEGPMGAGSGGNQVDGGAGEPSAGAAPGGGDLGAGGGGDPGAGGSGAGGSGAGDPGAVPGDQPAPGEPDAPPDPVDEAGKFIDVAGKGIDLLGKPADVAGKYIDLAEQLKGLGEGGTGAEEQDLKDLFPDEKFPDVEVPDVPDNPDEPSLAGGGAAGAPTFRPPDLGAGAGGSGTGGGAAPLGGIGSAGNFGKASGEASGAGGGSPSLAGGSASTAGTSGRSGMPPMMPPPMGGMGAGAPGGGQGDIKPGQAQSRGGFDVAKAQTTSEQLRRQGVQEDLQGRTNGEQRPASAVRQTRKRKDRGRTGSPAEQGVLDEELWRL